MLIRTPRKRVILICVCGRHKIGWKETKYQSDVETTQQRSWSGRTNIFLRSCTPGMHSKTMWNKQRYCWQLQNHVWIQNFRRSNWIFTMLGKSSYLFVVSWNGRSCKEMCRKILWVGEQKRLNNSAKYQLHASMTTTSKKKKQNLLENCQIHALKLFWNAYTWQELEDLIFYGQWISSHDQSQNGPKLVTNAWIDWFHIFIIRVNTHNIVTWVILLKMQTGTVSRFWLRGRSWRFEIHFWRNTVHFRKSYICSNKLDVQETNCCFAQFNRIWNYLFGHWTEIKACDKRLSRLRSLTFIIHVNSNMIVMWKYSTIMQVETVSRLRFCKRSWRFKTYIRWNIVHFRSHTFVAISWMCKKQTSVSP